MIGEIIESKYEYEFTTVWTKEKTRIKELIASNTGKYDEESIKEAAQLLFCDGNDVIRIAEGNFENDVLKLKTLSEYYGVSIDYILGLSDVI